MSATAPSTDNYSILKGTVAYQANATGAFVDLGNAPALVLTPQVEVLEHFSSRAGIKSKDKSVTVQIGGEISLTLDEINPQNLALAMLGSVSGSIVSLLSDTEVEGILRCTGTNSVGNTFNLDGVRVRFKPGQGLPLIGEEFATIELVGEWLTNSALNSVDPWGTLTET